MPSSAFAPATLPVLKTAHPLPAPAATDESIAAAFGCHLELHQPTVDRMQEHYDKRGVELNEARLRMARLPKDGALPALVLAVVVRGL